MNNCWYGSNGNGCYMLFCRLSCDYVLCGVWSISNMLLCCDDDKVVIMLIGYFVDKVVGRC